MKITQVIDHVDPDVSVTGEPAAVIS